MSVAIFDAIRRCACPGAGGTLRRVLVEKFANRLSAAGFFCSRTLRVTVSTSASDSGTRMVKRSSQLAAEAERR